MSAEIISRLHKPAAYQAAVVQLMADYVNRAVEKLELKETLPVMIPEAAKCSVDCPPDGIGGSILTPNYSFGFLRGRLWSVRKDRWLQKVSPPAQSMLDLARQTSLLDKESAYQLAVKWLASIGINVLELEHRFPPHVFQLQARRDRSQANLEPVPLFTIGWGGDAVTRPSSSCPVFVEILGTTKQLIGLCINRPELFHSPPLELPNAAQLIGPSPEPLYFVAQKFGGEEGFQTVAQPDKVEAWLLDTESPEGKARTEAVVVKPEDAKVLSQTLTTFNSFDWDDRIMKGCLPEYGVRLRFTREVDVVEVLICFMCSMLHITRNRVATGGGDFVACGALAKVIKTVFPNDAVIQSLRS